MKVVLKKDLIKGSSIFLKGSTIEVTRQYADELLIGGFARKENVIEKIKNKKLNGNNWSN